MRLVPAPFAGPQRTPVTVECPVTIRFAQLYARLCPCEAEASTKFSHLKSIYPRTSPGALALIWLLLTAGDVESNQGPRNWKYPCGFCSKPVNASARYTVRSMLLLATHKVIGMSPEEYSELQTQTTSGTVKSVTERLSLSRTYPTPTPFLTLPRKPATFRP